MKTSLYHIFNPEAEAARWEWIRSPTELRCYGIRISTVPHLVASFIREKATALGITAGMLQSPTNVDGIEVELLLKGTEKLLENLSKELLLSTKETAACGESILAQLKRARRRFAGSFRLGRVHLPLGKRTLIMGILNVTPDSFTDGGRYSSLTAAVERAYQMAEEGADIIDIGGESTRPGYQGVSEDRELSRVMPVIEALKSSPDFSTPLSIDTCKAGVAREALSAGVEMVNDIWGLKADPQLGAVTASFGVPICLMHNRSSTAYRDLVPEVIYELQESIDLARAAGIADDKILIDPGIGFGKDLNQNLAVMHRLADFRGLGYPLLLGTSRKSMIGKTLGLPPLERLEGTAATVAYGITAGADIIRVHDVREMRRVALMTDAMVRKTEGG